MTTLATKLGRFMTVNKLKPAKVALEAGTSRQHLYRIRKGIADPGFTLWPYAFVMRADGSFVAKSALMSCSDQTIRRNNPP